MAAQWEYCRLYVATKVPIPNVFSASPNVTLPRSNPPLDEVLVVLGTEGWELVNIMVGGDFAHLLFKRPRA